MQRARRIEPPVWNQNPNNEMESGAHIQPAGESNKKKNQTENSDG